MFRSNTRAPTQSPAGIDGDEQDGGGVPAQPRQATGSCRLNAAGLFGDARDGTLYEVGYLYQTTVVPGTPVVEVALVILDIMDSAIAEGILPTFFDCFGDGRRRLQTSGGSINAISRQPDDEVILAGRKCR